jgi:hypothetical protein
MEGARVPGGVCDIGGSRDCLASAFVDIAHADCPAIFFQEIVDGMALSGIHALTTCVVEQNLVELASLDLVGVCAVDERPRNDFPKVHANNVAHGAPPPDPAQFVREARSRKLVVHAEELADAQRVRKRRFADLVPMVCIALQEQNPVPTHGDQCGERSNLRGHRQRR